MRTIAAGALLAMLATGPVAASNHDRPAPNDISMDEARQVVQNEGYTDIRQIEFDDGQWEIEALDSNGREVDIDIDAASGDILRVDRD